MALLLLAFVLLLVGLKVAVAVQLCQPVNDPIGEAGQHCARKDWIAASMAEKASAVALL